jgi:hypothetical protein
MIKDLVTQHNNNLYEIKCCWQQPNSTEFFYLNNHKNITTSSSDIYIGYSWANHIDKKLTLDKSIIDFIVSLKNKKITICQHVKWKKLLSLWKDMNIETIYLSHCCKNKHKEDLNIQSWPLYASSVEGFSFENKIKKNKKYLASFIGCHRYDYRSKIRIDLNNYFHKNYYNNIYFELYDHWFYDRNIYENKPISDTQTARIKQYNDIMSDSVFSLCPEGTGPNTIRIWESMALGSIPVIYSDDWEPPEIAIPWSEFSIFIPQKDYEHTITILNSVSKEKIERMQMNCVKAYNSFKNMNCWKT